MCRQDWRHPAPVVPGRLHPDRDHGGGDHPCDFVGPGGAEADRKDRRSQAGRGQGPDQKSGRGASDVQARQRELPDHRAGARRPGPEADGRADPEELARGGLSPEGAEGSLGESVCLRQPRDPWRLRCHLVRRRRRIGGRGKKRRHRKLEHGVALIMQARARLPRTDRKTSAGFTLLELLLVIVILGVTAALILPRLSSFGTGDLKWTSRHFAGLIQHLAQESSKTKKIYRLYYNLENGAYWV